MKADLIDHCEVREAPRPGIARLLAARWRALAERFPFASNNLLSLVDQTIVSATSFATAIIVGRTASTEQLGVYYLVASIVVFSIAIHETLVSAPYTVYSKRKQGQELVEYQGSSWVQHFIVTVLGLIILFGAIAIVPYVGQAEVMPGLWALAWVGPFLLLREWIRRLAFASLQILPAIFVNGTVAIIQLGSLLVLFQLGRLTIFNIFFVMGSACALACAGWYLLSHPMARFRRDRFVADCKHNWGFSKWALRSVLVGTTPQVVMPWIVNAAVDTASAGILGACVTLVGVMNLLVLSVDRVLTPRAAQAFYEGGSAELRRVLGRTAVFLAIPLGLFCIGVFATGSLLAVLAYGDKFQQSGPLVAVLTLNTLVTGLGFVAANGLWATDKLRANFVADAGIMVVTLVAAALLVTPLGALGAAVATLAGSATGTLVRTIALTRTLYEQDHKGNTIQSTNTDT